MAPCPAHPEAEAVGTCARCGRFTCAAEQLEVDDLRYCADCGVRADVDWLGHHYRPLEGKRSGVAWVVLLTGLATGAAALVVGLGPGADWKNRTAAAAFAVYAFAAIAVITGKRATRLGLVMSSLISGGLFAVAGQEAWVGLLALPMLALAATAWTDVRTRLFFRVPVPRVELYKHYRRQGSNPLAILASRLAFLSLMVPGLGLLSLVLGVIALTRVDAKAVPPVGNLSVALGAVVFSVFTTLMWAATLARHAPH